MYSCRAYSSNVSKYATQMNPLDTLRDSTKQVNITYILTHQLQYCSILDYWHIQLYRRLCQWWRSLIQHLTLWNSIIKQLEGIFTFHQKSSNVRRHCTPHQMYNAIVSVSYNNSAFFIMMQVGSAQVLPPFSCSFDGCVPSIWS